MPCLVTTGRARLDEYRQGNMLEFGRSPSLRSQSDATESLLDPVSGLP